MRGTFERVTVKNNKALTGNGGGIHNTGSDELTILDSHVEGNTALNGGGLAIQSDAPIVVKGSLFLNNGARAGRDQEGLLLEESGRGGGIFSISDSGSLIENTTISGNFAKIAGGGLHHDADGELRLVHITIWRNAAPLGRRRQRRRVRLRPERPAAAAQVALRQELDHRRHVSGR